MDDMQYILYEDNLFCLVKDEKGNIVPHLVEDYVVSPAEFEKEQKLQDERLESLEKLKQEKDAETIALEHKIEEFKELCKEQAKTMENTNPSEEQVGKLDAHLEGELCKIFDKMHAVEELHEQGVKIINDTKEDVMKKLTTSITSSIEKMGMEKVQEPKENDAKIPCTKNLHGDAACVCGKAPEKLCPCPFHLKTDAGTYADGKTQKLTLEQMEARNAIMMFINEHMRDGRIPDPDQPTTSQAGVAFQMNNKKPDDGDAELGTKSVLKWTIRM